MKSETFCGSIPSSPTSCSKVLEIPNAAISVFTESKSPARSLNNPAVSESVWAVWSKAALSWSNSAMPLSTKIACDPAAFERSETEFAKFVAVELRAGKVSSTSTFRYSPWAFKESCKALVVFSDAWAISSAACEILGYDDSTPCVTVLNDSFCAFRDSIDCKRASFSAPSGKVWAKVFNPATTLLFNSIRAFAWSTTPDTPASALVIELETFPTESFACATAWDASAEDSSKVSMSERAKGLSAAWVEVSNWEEVSSSPCKVLIVSFACCKDPFASCAFVEAVLAASFNWETVDSTLSIEDWTSVNFATTSFWVAEILLSLYWIASSNLVAMVSLTTETKESLIVWSREDAPLSVTLVETPPDFSLT